MQKNNHGETPLHIAAREGHIDIAELLINKGADVNAKNNYGKTPFDYAKNEEIRQLLKRELEMR